MTTNAVTPVERRIKELNEKATQVLVFLSFAILGAATVSDKFPANPALVRSAMRCWVGAIFPVLVVVLPLKEIPRIWPLSLIRRVWPQTWWRWYEILRGLKVFLMSVAVVVSFVGAWYFLKAVSDP